MSHSHLPDEVDRRILAILQTDARTSNADISRQLEMAPSATLERLRKLERRGVITAYEARLDPKAVDRGLLAFVSLRARCCGADSDVTSALELISEVQEIHHVAGEDCFLLKVRTRDPEDLARLLRETLRTLPDVVDTRTTIVLETHKETSALPL